MSLQSRINFALSEVSNILDALSTRDLLSCRLVCQKWEEEASRLIKRRTDWNVPFVFCEHIYPPTFIRRFYRPRFSYRSCCPTPTDAPKRMKHPIVQFLKVLLRSKSHPPFLVSRIELDSGRTGLLELPEIIHFLRNYGAHIKELQLSNSLTYYLGQRGWGSKCILKYTPNLESLIVRVAGWTPTVVSPGIQARFVEYEDEGNNENILNFPHLKFVEILGKPDLHVSDLKLIDLLTLAPGVQIVRFNDTHFILPMIPVLLKANKLHLLRIKGIELELFRLFKNDLKELKYLEYLVGVGKIGLKSLHLTTNIRALEKLSEGGILGGQPKPELARNWTRMFVCLMKLLENNSKSLERVTVENAAAFLWKNPKTAGHIPKLQNVTMVTFKRQESSHRFLDNPTRYDYVPLFERLSAALPWSCKDFGDYSSMFTMFPGLKTVNIKRVHISNMFPFWDKIFPTVKNLHFHPLPDTDNTNFETTKLLAMFPTLNSLTMEIPASAVAHYMKQLLNFKLPEKLGLRIEPDVISRQEKPWNIFIALADLLGVQLNDLENLYQPWAQCGAFKIPSSFRGRPSVLNFENVKELYLTLRGFEVNQRLFFGECVGQLTAHKVEDFQVYFTFVGENDDDVKMFKSSVEPYPNIHLTWQERDLPF